MYKSPIIALGTTLLLLGACSMHGQNLHDRNMTADPSAARAEAKTNGHKLFAENAPLSKAGYSFAVRDIKQNGNTVKFTIPENARTHDKKGDAVELSGIYSEGKRSAKSCPVVDSHYVTKKVEHYEPLSGKADVIATFKDSNKARQAAQKGCLLIYDVG